MFDVGKQFAPWCLSAILLYKGKVPITRQELPIIFSLDYSTMRALCKKLRMDAAEAMARSLEL